MNKIIPFNKPYITNEELNYIKKVFANKNNNLEFGYQGKFSNLCCDEIKKITKSKNVLLTSSCTGALEIISKSIKIQKGDEVIIPSYNFVSSVDAFLGSDAKIVFCNVNKNFVLDLKDLKSKITKKTKAIVLVHYNGNSVDFDELKKILKNKKKIIVIEDAAAALGSMYKNKFLGTLGDFGCYSFHESKNIHCGNGGALLVNNKKFIKNTKLIWHRGTNREAFDKKIINRYEWVAEGKSSHISELQAAFLLAQLKNFKKNLKQKKNIFYQYFNKLTQYDKYFSLPIINKKNKSNFHTFFLVIKNQRERQKFIKFMNKNFIQAVGHYEPLHTSIIGKKIYKKKDLFSTYDLSKRIVRLPNYYSINKKQIDFVIKKTIEYFKID
jgi:dTDP-4-amino-4,6-dideoxygalactose transaminase